MTELQIRKVPKLRFREFSNEWEEKKLGDIAQFSKGKNISKGDVAEDGAIEAIRYGELYTRYDEVIKQIYSRTNLDSKLLVFSKYNDVIIPASGETNIDIATASCVLKHGVALSGDINIIRSENSGVFLAYYLNGIKKHDVARLGQGVSVVHLYSSNLKQLVLNLPSKEEQERIAEFLTTVNERISGLQTMKKLLEKYKKGTMQTIFSQKIRFKDRNGKDYPDWKSVKLGEYIKEYTAKSKVENQYPVLTSSRAGLVFQSDYFKNSRIAERSNQGFNIIPENFMTYRSRSDDGHFRFNINATGGMGIISTYYPVFEVINGSLLFFDFLLNFYKNTFYKYSVGTSQVVLSLNQLRKIKFEMPGPEEQQKIADFLTAIDDKINLTKKELEQAKVFKKALLQRMFV